MRIASFILLITSNALAATPWELLTQGATEDSGAKRAQAIAALGTIRTLKAEKLVGAALTDKDSIVRFAAVIALAETKSKRAIPNLKLALNDETAEVSFTAAKALWELGDRSGKEILTEVLAGERKESSGFVKKQMRDAKSTLHDRKALAWMGAKEGAGFLFGPLGYGLGLVEGLTKDSSAPARALSATLLAKDKDLKVLEELESALFDKSPLVRVAAVKALGGFPNRALLPKIQPLLDDKYDAVRYMAAASILRIEKSN